MPLQGTALLLFYLSSGFAASLNHTRYAVHIPYIYDVRDHDVHHRLPRCNYGQFVMWWDRLYGSFRRYEDSYNSDSSDARRERESAVAGAYRESSSSKSKAI